MNRLTNPRCSGIKEGYWSPAKKEELVQRLAALEGRGVRDRISSLCRACHWACSSRLRWAAHSGHRIFVWYTCCITLPQSTQMRV